MIKRHLIGVGKLTDERYATGRNVPLHGNVDAAVRPVDGMCGWFGPVSM